MHKGTTGGEDLTATTQHKNKVKDTGASQVVWKIHDNAERKDKEKQNMQLDKTGRDRCISRASMEQSQRTETILKAFQRRQQMAKRRSRVLVIIMEVRSCEQAMGQARVKQILYTVKFGLKRVCPSNDNNVTFASSSK